MQQLSSFPTFDQNQHGLVLDKTTWKHGRNRDILESINWETLLACFPTNVKFQADISICMKYFDNGELGKTIFRKNDHQSKRVIYISANENYLADPIQIIHTVCHELAHAFCKWNNGMIGFDSHLNMNLTGIDEGTTEIIASEVLAEYLKRVGFSKFITKRSGINHTSISYRIYEVRVKQFTRKIAELAGIPYDTAWEAIRTSYFESEDLTGLLTEEKFGICLPIKEVRKLLMNAGFLNEIRSLVRYIINPPV